MRAGAVLVDVAIDQGGCFETSRPTAHADPTDVIDGIVHDCVANMPGAVPFAASEAPGNATLPYGLMRAEGGLRRMRLAGCRAWRGTPGGDYSPDWVSMNKGSSATGGEVRS